MSNALNINSLQFEPIIVSNGDVVEAARHFLGLEYSSAGTILWSDDPPRGCCDCAGLFLLIARRLGLLPASFDPGLPYRIWRRPRRDLLLEIITINFTRIEREAARAGDLLFLKFPEHDAAILEEYSQGRHVALLTEISAHGQHSIIHAFSRRVFEQQLNASEWQYVKAAYRWNNTVAL